MSFPCAEAFEISRDETQSAGNSEILTAIDLTCEEALDVFENIPILHRKLTTLNEVGLGYIHMGQQATTLSGGEAQRIKLAGELSRVSTGQTLYILDEPTTGLHFADVQMLLGVLARLVDKGNTVVVIDLRCGRGWNCGADAQGAG